MELDDTVKATIEKLKTMGIYNDTLIVVTADHAREEFFWREGFARDELTLLQRSRRLRCLCL